MIYRYKVFTLVILFLSGCAAQKLLTYGDIEGRVLNLDGSPQIKAKVSVNAPAYNGRYPTNTEGKYKLTRVPTGKWELEFHCSSANYVGRHISTINVIVEEGAVARVNV